MVIWHNTAYWWLVINNDKCFHITCIVENTFYYKIFSYVDIMKTPLN